ncbi:UDP-N-acetylmuramate dehydrogenase [Parvularcula oceani]|uniref:UDP-N-acetylmuramate dehydrogenase n=1 Tax=Parvularcula oceani TaxID=1247963 RepID=UPI0004E1D170|nr:UDP-N-acetylmuramate dehydrogenase [Parvularcula oceani]
MTLRGRLLEGQALAPYTWFRVGGPADRLFIPQDTEDLAAFLAALPQEEPLTMIGVGSNLLVRDGGLRGTVIRLGPGFGHVSADGMRLRAGAGAVDAKLAKRAAAAGIAGLEFFRGIPGTVGGALRMNAGAYGGETADVLVEASALDRQGRLHTFGVDDLDYAYRSCGLPDEFIFVEALFEGRPGDPAAITERMDAIMTRREATQPVRERTGGSTFKNPTSQTDRSSWQLVDAVGGRGRQVGGARMSELHANFMINSGNATAADLEELGESIRKDVKAQTGVDLEWEIKRIGETA